MLLYKDAVIVLAYFQSYIYFCHDLSANRTFFMQLVLKAETRYYSADTVRPLVALASDHDIVEFVVWCEFSSLPLLFQVIAEISERANCLMIVQKVEFSFISIKVADSFWRFCVVAKL